jgi:hypothetical protein
MPLACVPSMPARRAQAPAPVRPMPVVMRGILAGDQPQMPRTSDEHPAGDFRPDVPHPPFRGGVRPWASRRDRHASIPAPERTAPDASVNWPARSPINNLHRPSRPPPADPPAGSGPRYRPRPVRARGDAAHRHLPGRRAA